MSKSGREGGQELNAGRPGQPEDATPAGQAEGISRLGERGTQSGEAAGTDETEAPEEPGEEPDAAA